jgi:hypothetical protein
MSLGAELVLLAIDDKQGDIRVKHRLGWVVAAADLIDLVLSGRVVMSGVHLVLRPADTTSDSSVYDAALRLVDSPGPVTVDGWIGRQGTLGQLHERVHRMERGGVVRISGRLSGAGHTDGSGVHVTDPDRQVVILDRLRGAARGGAQTSPSDQALILLADAAGLTPIHLGGLANRRLRKRIADLLDTPNPAQEPDRTVRAVTRLALRAIARLAHQDGHRDLGISLNHQSDLRWAVGAGFDSGPTI